MATVTRYVDTASGGGDGTTNGTGTGTTNAYASLNACEAAEDGVDHSGDDVVIHCNRTTGAGGGGQDTTAVTFAGWTVGTITIIGDSFPPDGILDVTNFYVLSVTSASNIESLKISVANTIVRNLQVQQIGSSTGTFAGIFVNGVDDITIDSCIVKGSQSGTGNARGIYALNTDDLYVYNTIVEGWISGADTGFIGIRFHCESSDNQYIYNCTIANNRYGLREDGSSTPSAKNCAVFNNGVDWYGSFSDDFCASDDSSPTSDADWVDLNENAGGEWDAAFTDYANGDFSLANDQSILDSAGDTDPGSGLYSDDMIGFTRGNWSIGALEQTDAIRYVDTASGGGDGTTAGTGTGTNNAYVSLSAAEAAEDGVTHSSHDVVIHCNRTTGDGGGGQDTTAVTFAGWTVSTVTIQGDLESDGKTGFPDVDGVLDDANFYIVHVTSGSNSSCIDIDIPNVTLRNLQLEYTGSSTGKGYNVDVAEDADDVTVDSCIIHGIHSGTGRGYGIYGYRCSNFNVYNCVIYGFVSSTNSLFRGIQIYALVSDTSFIYNCTIYGNYYGIAEAAASTAVATNCLVFNNAATQDFSGSVTMTYCASDDDHTGDSATNVHITQTASDYAALVNDAPNGDFRPTDDSSELYEAGDDDPGSGLYSVDIIDDAYVSPWSIGAYHNYVAAPPAGGFDGEYFLLF